MRGVPPGVRPAGMARHVELATGAATQSSASYRSSAGNATTTAATPITHSTPPENTEKRALVAPPRCEVGPQPRHTDHRPLDSATPGETETAALPLSLAERGHRRHHLACHQPRFVGELVDDLE